MGVKIYVYKTRSRGFAAFESENHIDPNLLFEINLKIWPFNLGYFKNIQLDLSSASENFKQKFRRTRVVDSADRGITRYQVLHHRYDPHRNCVRGVQIACFNTERGMLKLIKRLDRKLEADKNNARAMDYEYISGCVFPPEVFSETTEEKKRIISWRRNHGLNN